MARDYQTIRSADEWARVMGGQAAATRPTKKTAATTPAKSSATAGIYPVKTAGLVPALPGSNVKTQRKWEELLGTAYGNGGNTVIQGTNAAAGKANGAGSLAQTAAGGGTAGLGALGGGTTGLGSEPYSRRLKTLNSELSNMGPYESQYADEMKTMLADILGEKPYESQYGGQIADLYGKLTGAAPYESQFTDEIRGLYDQIQGRTPYESQYGGQIEKLYDKIINRPKFSYDPNKDPLFQQYREQYARGGQQAMRDTMGASAALTGGYGNSWGNTAGYQAYQNYMAALNDKIPELSQQAFDRYQQEGTDMQNRLALASAMDEAGYQRWQDEGKALADRLNTARAMDDAAYSRYQSDQDALRSKLSAAMAMDEDAYNRYLQAANDKRQNYNALANADAQDWERYLERLQLTQDQMKLLDALRTSEGNYQDTRRANDLAYKQQLQQMGLLYPAAASAMPAAMASGGGGGDAGSNFNTREWQASRNGIKSGALKKDQSPLTTLGNKKAMDQWYDDMYRQMDAAQTGTAPRTSQSSAGSGLLDMLQTAVQDFYNAGQKTTQPSTGKPALTNKEGKSLADILKEY